VYCGPSIEVNDFSPLVGDFSPFHRQVLRLPQSYPEGAMSPNDSDFREIATNPPSRIAHLINGILIANKICHSIQSWGRGQSETGSITCRFRMTAPERFNSLPGQPRPIKG
jgi:hypothetical protein